MDNSAAKQNLLHDEEDGHRGEDIEEFDSLITKALTDTLHGSAKLSNMLPTGTVLFFQLLDPILSGVGSCWLSLANLIICSLVCFLLSFTDSFHAPNGKVYYGVATFQGLWTPQVKCSMNLSDYKLHLRDFIYAFLIMFAFLTTTTSSSSDVIQCFVKVPDGLLRAAPPLSGFLISFLFLIVHTKRHGVGFPRTPAASEK